MSGLKNPPRNGEGDHEVVEGCLLASGMLALRSPSVSLRLPPPRAGEEF